MKRIFENNAYRYHSCGCYRAGVTRIDAKGADPCPKHEVTSRVWWTWHPSTWAIFIGAEPEIGWVSAIQIGPFNYARGSKP